MRTPDTTMLFAISVAVLGAVLAMSFLFFGKPPLQDSDSFREEFGLVLTDYDGKEVRLSEFRRKVLIVYAWASWCPYCADELKNLAQLKQQYGDVTVIAVNRAEPVAVAKQYTDALGTNDMLIFLLDPEDTLYKNIQGYAMPETIFINESGAIIFHQRGPIQIEAVEEKIRELLGVTL